MSAGGLPVVVGDEAETVLRQVVEEIGDAVTPRLEESIDKLIDAAAASPTGVLREAERRGLGTTGPSAWDRVASLGRHDVAALDDLAASFVQTYMVIAGAQGFLTGSGGFVTMPVTVPADTLGFVVWIVRTTSAAMYSYGFEAGSDDGRAGLRLGLLAAMGVPRVRIEGTDVMLAGLARQAMSSPYREAAAHAPLRAVVRRAGVVISQRHVAKVVPAVGGVLNGAVAAGLVRVCGRRSARYYRELRLATRAPLDG